MKLEGGVGALASLKRPTVKRAIKMVGLLGLLGFFAALGFSYYLTQTSPLLPSTASGQIASYESRGATYYIRPIEVLALNLGFACAWGVSALASAIHCAIFGVASPHVPSFLNVVVTVVLGAAGFIFLAVFLFSGGNWPVEGFS